jgi:threonine/homoserine/homoserine lactone efflux protein
MPPELLLPLASFCLVSSITPGPNNMMLLSSGATFGLRRTVPHIAGISGGCALMVLVLGWALAGVIGRAPVLFTALHIVSTIYLLWLAWRIATSTGPHGSRLRARPFGTVDAAGFQWANPKAWAMVLGAITNFARPDHLFADVLLIALMLMAIGLPCIVLWAGSGQLLRRFLSEPRALRIFNFSMATLLIASILPGIWQALAKIS